MAARPPDRPRRRTRRRRLRQILNRSAQRALLRRMVGPPQIAGYRRAERLPGGQQPLAYGSVVGGERITQASGELGVVAYEIGGAPCPQVEQDGRGDRHAGDPARIPGQALAAAVLVHVEGDRAVFDLLRAVPAQQVEHDLVGVGEIQTLGRQDPVAKDRRELLDRRDHRQPEAQPLLGRYRRAQGRLLAQQFLEEEVDVLREVRGVEPLRRQMIEDVRVLHAVRRLLAHEPLDVPEEFGVVVDERECLLEDLHEPPLPRGQQQM